MASEAAETAEAVEACTMEACESGTASFDAYGFLVSTDPESEEADYRSQRYG